MMAGAFGDAWSTSSSRAQDRVSPYGVDPESGKTGVKVRDVETAGLVRDDGWLRMGALRQDTVGSQPMVSTTRIGALARTSPRRFAARRRIHASEGSPPARKKRGGNDHGSSLFRVACDFRQD